MKQFARTVVATALLFAAIAVGITVAIERRDCVFKYKADYMQRNKADIKTLVAGHSHMMNGVNPSLLGDSCFNVALGGIPMELTRLLLEHFVPQMPRLQTVILPLSYDMELFGLDKQFVLTKELLCGHYFKLWEGRHTLGDRLVFLHSKTFLNLDDIDTAGHGFMADSVQFDGRSPYGGQYGNNGSLLPSLVKIGQVCHDHGVRLIVVSAPFAPSYRVHVTQAEEERIAGIVDSARSQVPFDYHSYLADPDFGSDTLFRDGRHLNVHGAAVFTQRLKRDFGL